MVKKCRKRFLQVIGICVLLLYIARVIWVNVQYNNKFQIMDIETEGVLHSPEWGVNVKLLGSDYYSNVEQIISRYGKPVAEEYMFDYWSSLDTEYYLLELVVEISNNASEEIYFDIMRLYLNGGYWGQVAQTIFKDQPGDYEKWSVELQEKESVKMHLIFQFRNEDGFYRMYQDARENTMYLNLSGNHVWYRLVVQ